MGNDFSGNGAEPETIGESRISEECRDPEIEAEIEASICKLQERHDLSEREAELVYLDFATLREVLSDREENDRPTVVVSRKKARYRRKIREARERGALVVDPETVDPVDRVDLAVDLWTDPEREIVCTVDFEHAQEYWEVGGKLQDVYANLRKWAWRKAIFLSTLDSTPKLILQVLCSFASDDGTDIFPRVETAAKRASFTTRTLENRIPELEAQGWIRRVNRLGTRGSYIYVPGVPADFPYTFDNQEKRWGVEVAAVGS